MTRKNAFIIMVFLTLTSIWAETWTKLGEGHLEKQSHDKLLFAPKWILAGDSTKPLRRYAYYIYASNLTDRLITGVRFNISFFNAFKKEVFSDTIEILDPIKPGEMGMGFSVLNGAGIEGKNLSSTDDKKANLFRQQLEHNGANFKINISQIEVASPD